MFSRTLKGKVYTTNEKFPLSTKTNISKFHFYHDRGDASKPAKSDANFSLNI